jgi:hypothetical protein
MSQPAWKEDEIGRPVTKDLIRDVDVTALGVLRFRDHWTSVVNADVHVNSGPHRYPSLGAAQLSSGV